MFAANTYHIRLATDQDTDKLHGLAQRNSQQPLSGRVLIGEIAGVGAAALSLSDGRVVFVPGVAPKSAESGVHGDPSSSSAKQKAILPGLPWVARSTSPGRPPPTLRTTS